MYQEQLQHFLSDHSVTAKLAGRAPSFRAEETTQGFGVLEPGEFRDLPEWKVRRAEQVFDPLLAQALEFFARSPAKISAKPPFERPS